MTDEISVEFALWWETKPPGGNSLHLSWQYSCQPHIGLLILQLFHDWITARPHSTNEQWPINNLRWPIGVRGLYLNFHVIQSLFSRGALAQQARLTIGSHPHRFR